MGTSRYTNYGSVNWDIPIWSPDWKQVDSLLTNKEQGYQLAQAALDAPIDSSNLGTDPMVREQLRLNREQAQADLAKTYAQPNGLQAGNKALQSYLQQIGREKQPGGVEYQLMQNKAAITAYNEKIDKAEGWSPEQKQQWLSMNLADYKGAVYKDELKGFSGQDLSKFINDSLYAQKYLEKMKPSTEEGYVINTETGQQLTVGGKAIYSGGDGYYYWDKMKHDRLSTQAQISAVYPAMQQDPEYQAYMQDKSAIKLYSEAGITQHNWQQATALQNKMIEDTLINLDILKTKDEKIQALKELTGNDYSKVDEQTITSKLEVEKNKLKGKQEEIGSIKSYKGLLQYQGNNDLLKTVSTNAEMYKVDNFSITSERFIDQFLLEQVKLQNSLKLKKAEDEVVLPDYWKEHIIKINDELVSGADAFDTYDKLAMGINKYYKELPTNIATLNHEFKTKIANNPESPLYKALIASGFDPSKEDFVKLTYDENSGNVVVDQTNLDKFGKLSSAEGIGNTVQTFLDNQKRTANQITLGQSQLSLLVKKYQEYTGDKNIIDNLKDFTSNSFLNGENKVVNQSIKFKQLQEVNPNNYKSAGNILLDAIKYNKNSPDSQKKLYEEYIKENPQALKTNEFSTLDNFKKTATYILGNSESLEAVKNNSSTTNEIGYATINKGNFNILKNFIGYVENKVQPEIEKNKIKDLLKEQKKKNYEEAMKELAKTQSSFETLYSISPSSSTDSKITKVINEKKKALNQEIASIVISKGAEAELLSDVSSGNLITDKDLKDRIINALNSQKSYDEEGNLLPQKDNVDYHVGQKNGELYGVMNVNFADEYKGKHSYAVQFKIGDETPSLRKFIVEDEQLFQQNELLRTQEIAKQIKSNNAAITNYTLPDGEKFNININRKVKTAGDSDGSEYQARIVLPKKMQDRGGQSATFIEFNTNDIATAPRIVGILEKISTNADYFKTIKETRFPGDDIGFLKFITQDIVDMTNGKIGAYQATQLYDWLIKPLVDKGQILQQQAPPGNFTNPQGFRW